MDAPKSCSFSQPHIPEATTYQLRFLWYKITKSNEFGFERTGSLLTYSQEMGMPVDIVNTARFFARDASLLVNGTIIT